MTYQNPEPGSKNYDLKSEITEKKTFPTSNK
jgi:hypothetical protein